MKHTIRMVLLFLFIFLLNIQVCAHPGRTDSDGGHHDNVNGGYHYHHGEPEHQHPNGVCPYYVDEVASSASSSEADEEFIRNVVYVFLGLLVFGVANRIRWGIKERRRK